MRARVQSANCCALSDVGCRRWRAATWLRALAHARRAAAAKPAVVACGNAGAGGRQRRVEEEETHEQGTCAFVRSGRW